MKQKIQILATLIFSIILTTSCIYTGPSLKGNGNVVEETRKTRNFDEIKVTRGMNVYISQGDFTKVVVKADKNLLDVIETKVEGNTLKVTSTQNIRNATSKKVYITIPDISVIKSTAGSNVFSETELKSKSLELSSSAGSNMKLELNINDLDVSANAGSNIRLKGIARNFNGSATSGSNIKAEDLNAKNGIVKVSSGANFWISVKDDFEGHASSGGNIFYYGNPESTDIHKSSGGNIIKK